uniref:Nucleoporin_N domain-containing protein n=1 Tax=Syphacia muris TaxID=451379 RepID=A0A0N5AEC5_9BILA
MIEQTKLKYDALESASNRVQFHQWKDREFSDLLFKLKFDPNQPDKVTISGLATEDYPSLRDFDVSEFSFQRIRPFPQQLIDQLNNAQCIYTVGLLPEIGRAYMTIDAELFLWNFEDSCDLAYFDSIPNTVTKVTIAKPKPGVFQEHIHYLLVVATSKEVLLLAASFTNSNNVTIPNNGLLDVRHAEMYLLPEALFKIPLEGSTVADIVATENGRIFFAEEESLYELDYQDKSWFQRKCKKMNRSKGLINYLLPSFSILTGKEEKIMRLCVDDTRHILYVLTINGSIQVFDLGDKGTTISKVASLTYGQIQERAAVECRTVDASFFSDVVSISAIPATHSQYLHLMAVTRKGVRLYFTCFGPTPQSVLNGTPNVTPSCLPNVEGQRPCDLRLRHVRIPPGFGALSHSLRPFTVYDAFSFHEINVMAGTFNREDDSAIWLYSSSNFPFQECLIENVVQFPLNGTVLGVDEAFSSIAFPSVAGSAFKVFPPKIVKQSDLSSQKLFVLTEKGIGVSEQRLPVDILREILRQFGADSPQLSFFVQLHGLLNAAVMALIIVCSGDPLDVCLKDSALRMFYSLGVELSDAGENRNTSSFRSPTSNFSHQSFRNTSIADLTYHIRSPLQASTPQQVRSIRSPQAQSSFHASLLTNEDHGLSSQQSMSCRHDCLYLYFSRLLGDVWSIPLCYKTPQDEVGYSVYNFYLNLQLLSTCSSPELDALTVSLVLYKKAIDEYSLLGNAREIQPGAAQGDKRNVDGKSGRLQEERKSLLNFYELLSITIEVLSLWSILSDHQFKIITAQLSESIRQQLCETNFCTLIVGGGHLCAELITCLIRYYLGDNATTDVICEELRRRCPTLFSDDDATAAKATEMVEEARHMEPCAARSHLLSEAVRLLTIGVQNINLPMICNLLFEVDCLEGIVDLSLSRAERDDTKMLGLIAYRSRSGEGDPLAQQAFIKRKEAYKCITDALDRIILEDKSKHELGRLSAVARRDLIINAVLKSNDELANIAIFKWLLDNDLSGILLQSKSPFLEMFLHRKVEEGASNRYLDLLWRFHEKNGDYWKAAQLLFNLAQRETDAFDTRRRVAYLSQAAMCTQSAVGSEKQSSLEAHEFLQEVRDKLDVAQVQLATKDEISRLPRSPANENALGKLERRLYTVQELFEEFAIPFSLPNIKLALCHCSGTYDKEIIENLCTEIINQELAGNKNDTVETRIERLGTTLAYYYKHYSGSPKYFPLETLLCDLLNRGLREGFPASMLDTIGVLTKVPMSMLLDVLITCFRKDPFWRNNESACCYIMQSAMKVLNRFESSKLSFSIDQRKTLVSKCLDLISTLLLHLSSRQSAAGSVRAQFIENFKTLQTVFDNF